MSKRVIRGASVMALDGRRTLRQTDVLIDRGVIAAIGGVDAAGALVTQVRGVLLPALVQTHIHSTLALTDQHFVPDVNPWILTRYQLEAWHRSVDPEASRIQALGAYSRGVHAGAGTFGDAVGRDVAEAVDAAAELGVRLVVCLDAGEVDLNRAIDRTLEYAASRGTHELVACGLFAGSAERTPIDRLRHFAAVANERRVPLFVHAGVLPNDRGALLRLERAGAVGPHLVLCHARAEREMWRSDRVLSRLAEAGASVVVSPAADVLLNAEGPDVAALLAAGVNVAIGSEFGATRVGFDAFKELRLLCRRIAAHVEAPASRALEIGAWGGARALGLESGTIQVGRKADLMLIGLEPTPNEDHEHLAARLIESVVPDSVRTVWINGEVAILDGRIAKGDPPAESAEESVRGRLCYAVETRMRKVSALRRAVLDLRFDRSHRALWSSRGERR